MFQFTLPRGERLLLDSSIAKSGCFNSRSREGSDLLHFFKSKSGSFQFTLPRGERQSPTENPSR